MLKEGDRAPDFELPDQDGQPFRLADQDSDLLLVFYPGDFTPVCTRQLCDYRDGADEFSGLGVRVVGISGDDAESHRRFRAQHGLDFTLLTDDELTVAEAYGAKKLLGMGRAVFLVDRNRVIRYAHVEAVALFRRSRDELLAAIRRVRGAGKDN